MGNLFDDIIRQMNDAKHSRQIGRFILIVIMIIALLMFLAKNILLKS